jgi:hypothetical protein
MDTIAIVAAGVNVIALGGFAWWIVGWLRSLKGAVDAQRVTIAAQKEFIQGLQALLELTDSPKMLERYEAYKKIVDHEKESLKRALEARRAEAQGKLASAEIWSDDMINLFFDLTPYVAEQDRTTVIESTQLSDSAKMIMRRFANLIPDLSTQKRLMTSLEARLRTLSRLVEGDKELVESLSDAQEKKT